MVSNDTLVSRKLWYAVYVRSRAEKKIYDALLNAGFEAFLPLVTQRRQWSDRIKKVEEPLFRSYVFVRIVSTDFFRVMRIDGVVCIVSFENIPAVIPDNQIQAIKKYVEGCSEVDTMHVADLNKGQMVRIVAGRLAGLTGRLMSFKNKRRLIVYIDVVGQYIPVDVARCKVEPISEK